MWARKLWLLLLFAILMLASILVSVRRMEKKEKVSIGDSK